MCIYGLLIFWNTSMFDVFAHAYTQPLHLLPIERAILLIIFKILKVWSGSWINGVIGFDYETRAGSLNYGLEIHISKVVKLDVLLWLLLLLNLSLNILQYPNSIFNFFLRRISLLFFEVFIKLCALVEALTPRLKWILNRRLTNILLLQLHLYGIHGFGVRFLSDLWLMLLASRYFQLLLIFLIFIIFIWKYRLAIHINVLEKWILLKLDTLLNLIIVFQ